MAADADCRRIGSISDAELKKANEVVQSLRTLRTRYHTDWSAPVELFVPHAKLDHESRRTNERKVKFFNQTALWNGLLLKQEFKLKLLSCLDGYLAAVDSENPVLMYLTARYLLELVATIAYLDFELREALKANPGDWEGRGVRFVTTLCRGGYASSDPKIAEVLQTVGVSNRAVKPISIDAAVRQLFEAPRVHDGPSSLRLPVQHVPPQRLGTSALPPVDAGDRSDRTAVGRSSGLRKARPGRHAVLSAGERRPFFVGANCVGYAGVLRLVGNYLARTACHAVLRRRGAEIDERSCQELSEFFCSEESERAGSPHQKAHDQAG